MQRLATGHAIAQRVISIVISTNKKLTTNKTIVLKFSVYIKSFILFTLSIIIAFIFI